MQGSRSVCQQRRRDSTKGPWVWGNGPLAKLCKNGYGCDVPLFLVRTISKKGDCLGLCSALEAPTLNSEEEKGRQPKQGLTLCRLKMSLISNILHISGKKNL